MLLLSCRQMTKSYDDVDVLKGVNLDIEVGERVGMIGKNGCGKSTLASIIAGELRPDSGDLTWWLSEAQVGYMRQSPIARRVTPSGEFLRIASHLRIQQATETLATCPAGLSGGEKTKLVLAQVWAAQPDLLILDEPTNHMDTQGVEWLIEQLAVYRGSILIISHDRYVLDQVTTRTLEIEDGKATSYGGNYSFYRREKARAKASQLHQYEEMRRQQNRIEKEIERVKRWSAKAHREAGKKSDIRKGVREFERSKAKRMDRQVKSKVKRLQRLLEDGPPKPREDPQVRFALQSSEKHGRRIIVAKDVAKSFPGKLLFSNSSFYVQRGDKVGLSGPNGCGKTTLFRIITGEQCPDEGTVWVSPSAKVGYLSQEDSLADCDKSAIEVLGLAERRFESEARTLLARIGITERLIHKPMMALSSGERTKIEIARLVLSQTTILLLDEPTNHLDIHSREQLEEALKAYDGTVIIASHDRYLLEAVCGRILAFEEGQIRCVEG